MPTLCGMGCCMLWLDERELSFASWGVDFLSEVVLETPAEDTVEEGFTPGAESTLESGGDAKASSASASVTRLVSAGSEDVGPSPNSNFWPRSCNRENSSRDGKRDASSSAAARLTWTS